MSEMRTAECEREEGKKGKMSLWMINRKPCFGASLVKRTGHGFRSRVPEISAVEMSARNHDPLTQKKTCL